MEQKTLLAIILSLMVLVIYGSLTHSNTKKSPNITQLYEQEMVTKSVAPSPVANEPLPSPPSESFKFEEKIQQISNRDLAADFSNVGGVIREVKIKKYNYSLPVFDVLSIRGYEKTEFNNTGAGENWIEYSYQDEKVSIIKRFSIPEDDHIMKAEIQINTIPAMSKDKEFSIDSFKIDMSRVDNKKITSEGILYEYSVSTNYAQIFRKNHAVKFTDQDNKVLSGFINWIGFRDRYFCTILKPLFQVNKSNVKALSDKELAISISITKPEKSEEGSNNSYQFLIYFGPQDLNLMKKYNVDFEQIMSFSNFGLFDLCAKGIYHFINFLHKMIPNWGACIILISLIIYGTLYPLTFMGMSSMRKMQSLQPQLAKLKEQYKNNPQKLNKEVMELYKINKINPFGGCLPFLLQMPIFIGLYQVLWRSIFFKGAGFLWIKDLAEPDRLFILPFYMPFLGNEFNILPILMAIVMFFQQKISAKSMVIVDPDQAMQQKMMAIFFPIFLGFVFYRFASGLSLYFTTFYSLSTLTQLKMSKMKAA